jgi:hypothetical protein
MEVASADSDKSARIGSSLRWRVIVSSGFRPHRASRDVGKSESPYAAPCSAVRRMRAKIWPLSILAELSQESRAEQQHLLESYRWRRQYQD